MQGVVSVDEQGGIFWIKESVSFKSGEFVLKEHDPRVSHGAGERDIEKLTSTDSGS